MPNHYCPSCGSPTAYLSAPPKFCGSCGKSLSIASASTSQPIKTLRAKQAPIFLQQEEDVEIPQLDKLEIIVTQSRGQGRKADTIGQIWGTEAIDTGRVGKVNLKAKRRKIDPAEFMSDAKSDETPIDLKFRE